jgi:hypothetical protein
MREAGGLEMASAVITNMRLTLMLRQPAPNAVTNPRRRVSLRPRGRPPGRVRERSEWGPRDPAARSARGPQGAVLTASLGRTRLYWCCGMARHCITTMPTALTHIHVWQLRAAWCIVRENMPLPELRGIEGDPQ